MALWNPWHGCHKLSDGCANCYVYRIDQKHGKDSSVIAKTGNFNLPLKKNRAGQYKILSGDLVYTCFTSDFLFEGSDEWRAEAWEMMKIRNDLHFLFITKRIDRFDICKPDDWGDGYDNVTVCCTVENQDRADYRLPIFIKAPIKHKSIICEPLLERIDLSSYLGTWTEDVVVGGESGNQARICDFDWVLDIRRQCIEHNVKFYFKQTGANFKKDGRLYFIKRKFQHSQAKRAKINYYPKQIDNQLKFF